MEPEIKRILYATDLSPNSLYAMRFASKIARQNDGRIIILHVIEKIPATAYALLSTYLDEDQMSARTREGIEYQAGQIRKRLDLLCEKECRFDPELVNRVARIEVREGYPADEILKEADAANANLIVMGTHGKGVLENTFVGSVAQRVMRRSRRPIFIVPLPKGPIDVTIEGATADSA
ncbi:MAG: universal stress protein [Desulfobacterales bacterium]|nr:universal stress protein [Desulfobacterales bacterium]